MTADSEKARPGLAPGTRSPMGTLFAALYGEFAPHPWRDPDAAPDAYILFYDRSLAMRWLHDLPVSGVHEGVTRSAGLWGMNDAGQDHPLAAPGSSLAAWFQVGVEPVPADRPLPVQPFLRCAGDAVERIGILRLQAVQVLLPVQGLDPSARPDCALMPSLLTAGWFGAGDARSRTPVRVTLDSGQAPSIPPAASRMREWLSRLHQDVFECASHSLSEHDPLADLPPFADGFWNGPPRHRATFHGVLTEWSLDALGWLGALFADLGARHGVSTPLLLTASRLPAQA